MESYNIVNLLLMTYWVLYIEEGEWQFALSLLSVQYS
jgi:hypothetical protein